MCRSLSVSPSGPERRGLEQRGFVGEEESAQQDPHLQSAAEMEIYYTSRVEGRTGAAAAWSKVCCVSASARVHRRRQRCWRSRSAGAAVMHVGSGGIQPIGRDTLPAQAPGYPAVLAVALGTNSVGIYTEEVRVKSSWGAYLRWAGSRAAAGRSVACTAWPTLRCCAGARPRAQQAWPHHQRPRHRVPPAGLAPLAAAAGHRLEGWRVLLKCLAHGGARRGSCASPRGLTASRRAHTACRRHLVLEL